MAEISINWLPAAVDETYQAKVSYDQCLLEGGLSDGEVEEVGRVYGRKLQE